MTSKFARAARLALVAALATTAPLLACSGDPGSTGAGGSGTGGNEPSTGPHQVSEGSVYRSFCEDYAAAYDVCKDGGALPPAGCEAYEACFLGVVRESARVRLYTCLTDHVCDDDYGNLTKRCYVETAADVPTTTASEAFYAKQAEVENAGCDTKIDSDDDDDFPWQLLTDELYGQLTECLGKPCASIPTCLQTFFTDLKAGACSGVQGYPFFDD